MHALTLGTCVCSHVDESDVVTRAPPNNHMQYHRCMSNSSGLLPLDASVMTAEKRKLLLSFLIFGFSFLFTTQ